MILPASHTAVLLRLSLLSCERFLKAPFSMNWLLTLQTKCKFTQLLVTDIATAVMVI